MGSHDDVLSELNQLRRFFDPATGDRITKLEASVRRKDWPGALTAIRTVLEGVLLAVAKNTNAPDLKGKTLQTIYEAIKERLTIPPTVDKHIRHVQEWGNYGAHAQDGALTDLSIEVGTALQGLRQVMGWASKFVDPPSGWSKLRASKAAPIAAVVVLLVGGTALALGLGGGGKAEPDAAPAPAAEAPAAAEPEEAPSKAAEVIPVEKAAAVDPAELREAVALRADDAQASAEALLGLLQRHPNDGDVLYELGQTYRKLGDKDEAFIFNTRACKAGNQRACRVGRPPAPMRRN